MKRIYWSDQRILNATNPLSAPQMRQRRGFRSMGPFSFLNMLYGCSFCSYFRASLRSFSEYVSGDFNFFFSILGSFGYFDRRRLRITQAITQDIRWKVRAMVHQRKHLCFDDFKPFAPVFFASSVPEMCASVFDEQKTCLMKRRRLRITQAATRYPMESSSHGTNCCAPESIEKRTNGFAQFLELNNVSQLNELLLDLDSQFRQNSLSHSLQDASGTKLIHLVDQF